MIGQNASQHSSTSSSAAYSGKGHHSSSDHDSSRQRGNQSSFRTYLFRLVCFTLGSVVMLVIVTMRSDAHAKKMEFFKDESINDLDELSSNSAILLDPRQAAQTITVSPYEVHQIYVPADACKAGAEYWIRASFEGADGLEIAIERKQIKQERTGKDFNKRHKQALKKGLGLRDHRYPQSFTLVESQESEQQQQQKSQVSHLVYKDDLQSQKFEIIRNPLGDSKDYLSFSMIAIVQAHAYDEAILFENKRITLRIISDSLDSFSEVNSFSMSLVATIAIFIAFIGILVKLILPKEVLNPILTQLGIDTGSSGHKIQ